jgi:hypothetical protein
MRHNDYHHVHFLCPRDLWNQFRRMYPRKGDLTRGMCEAIEIYLRLIQHVRCSHCGAVQGGPGKINTQHKKEPLGMSALTRLRKKTRGGNG